MMQVMRHIRGYIYCFNTVLAIAIFFYAQLTAGAPSLAYIELAEVYGIIASVYLYFALLASPLYSVIPLTPGKRTYTHARRAIGVSTFGFALLHTWISFFQLLEGFQGLPFLGSYDLFTLSLAAVALFILFLMAITSNDYSWKKLGPWWKRIHRFVYLAALLIFIHIVTFGAQFMFFTGPYYIALITATAFLLILQIIRSSRKIYPGTTLSLTIMWIGVVLVGGAWAFLVFDGEAVGTANMESMGMNMNGMNMDMPGMQM